MSYLLFFGPVRSRIGREIPVHHTWVWCHTFKSGHDRWPRIGISTAVCPLVVLLLELLAVGW